MTYTKNTKRTYKHLAEQIVKIQCERGGLERDSYDFTVKEDETYCRYKAVVEYEEMNGYAGEIKINIQFIRTPDDGVNIFTDVYSCPGDQCMSAYVLKEETHEYRVLDVYTGEILLKGDITL